MRLTGRNQPRKCRDTGLEGRKVLKLILRLSEAESFQSILPVSRQFTVLLLWYLHRMELWLRNLCQGLKIRKKLRHISKKQLRKMIWTVLSLIKVSPDAFLKVFLQLIRLTEKKYLCISVILYLQTTEPVQLWRFLHMTRGILSTHRCIIFREFR